MPTQDLGLVNNEIVSVNRTGTGAPGTTDTYTITLRGGQTFQFQVTNGTVVDAAPSGVYSTLEALQAAHPTGDSNHIYLVTSTGHWYYWNGSAWTDGGAYLSVANAVPDSRTIAGIDLVDDISKQELSDALTDEEIKDSIYPVQNKAVADLFDIDYGVNLLDPSEIVDGKYVDPTDGRLYSNSSYHTSGFIKVTPGQVISWQSSYFFVTIRFIAAFNENKAVMSASGATGTVHYTVPEGVAFIRASIDRGTGGSMIILGSTTKFYQAYHKPYYVLKENSFDDNLKKSIETSNCFHKIIGTNLFDISSAQIGRYLDATGVPGSSDSYLLSNLIPIEEGQTLSFWEGNGRPVVRFVTAFDINGGTLTTYSIDGGNITSYTSPSGSGVRFLYITFYNYAATRNTIMVLPGTDSPTVFIPYQAPRWVLNEDAIPEGESIESLFSIDYGVNLLNLDEKVDGKYVDPTNGVLYTNSSYRTTGFIPVQPGQTIVFQSGYQIVPMRFLAAYNANKENVSSAGATDASSYTVPNGVSFIRMSTSYGLNSNSMIIVGTNTTFLQPYHEPRYELKNDTYNSEIQKTVDVSECFEEAIGVNLFDINSAALGRYVQNDDGSIGSNDEYLYSNLIPIKEGQTLSFIENGSPVQVRFVTALDANGGLIAEAGTSSVYSYTSELGGSVRFLIVTFPNHAATRNSIMIVDSNNIPDEFVFYKALHYVLKENALELNKVQAIQQQNYFDKNAPGNVTGKYLSQGHLYPNPDYFSTDFIEVEPNATYSLSDSQYNYARFVECYNASKQFISGTDLENAKKITTTSATKYIRATFFIRSLNDACIVKGENQQIGLRYEKLLDGSLVSCNRNLLVFLPKEIYCVVGTTIEIYNKQVMPSADKYHFRWICRIGKPLNRKFTVTGAAGNVGSYPLTLQIYDDTGASLCILNSTLKVVNALATQKTVCPIGDSLTNSKYWLKYVNVNLSNGNIQYVGTRGYTTGQRHEGRSGWTAGQYLRNTNYTFDNPTGPNPFWDNTLERFSWSYYKTTYNMNPDVVQIWLGTNDLTGGGNPQNFVNNIKQMVQYIRQDDANIPIFICLTILAAEQNGIGATTNADGFNSEAGGWQLGWWTSIITGVKMLEKALLALSDANLHIIPLFCSHDSKYNFGLVETPVNPHTPSITEPMPTEGIHPKQNGYEQIGDILYSAYCAKLG